MKTTLLSASRTVLRICKSESHQNSQLYAQHGYAEDSLSRFARYGRHEYVQPDGRFYAVSQILGHSVDDFSQQMGVNLSINTVTTRYVQVQEQRKLNVLSAYHRAVFAVPEKDSLESKSL